MMDKPDLDSIEGLSPGKINNAEIYDYIAVQNVCHTPEFDL